MNIHQHPCQAVRVPRVVLLPLSYVDEALSEPVAVLGVVSAAAPHPVIPVAAALTLAEHGIADGGRLRTATAAACRELGVAACPADRVYDSCGRQRVHQSCLAACWTHTTSQMTLTEYVTLYNNFYSASALLAMTAVIAWAVCLFVCLSVRHVPVFCPDE